VNIGSKEKSERQNRLRRGATLALRRYNRVFLFLIHLQNAVYGYPKRSGTEDFALAQECSVSLLHTAVTHRGNSADKRKLRATPSRFPRFSQCNHSINKVDEFNQHESGAKPKIKFAIAWYNGGLKNV
jgi:hypothetical protein